jgi:hypothetical protein
MNFSFTDYPDGADADGGSFEHASGQVSIENAEYLPDILDSFKRFLHMAGFTYAAQVVVVNDAGGEHSSRPF